MRHRFWGGAPSHDKVGHSGGIGSPGGGGFLRLHRIGLRGKPSAPFGSAAYGSCSWWGRYGGGCGRWDGSIGARGGCHGCGGLLGGVVAVWVRFLGGPYWCVLLVVGRQVGLGGWRVLWPSLAVVLPVNGGCRLVG